MTGVLPPLRMEGTDRLAIPRSRSAISATGYRSLDENQVVEFDITQGDKGPQATNVRVV